MAEIVVRTRLCRAPVRLTPLAAALGLGLGFGMVPAAYAATFTVINLNDSGAGSLRAAIASANGAGGADIVDFQAGLTGTITLASEIAITDSVTITGPGAGSMNLAPGSTNRALKITGGTTNVTISGLTFTGNGTANVDGGAIYFKGAAGAGSVTIQNSVFTGNVTTGDGGALFLYQAGAMTIQASTFTGNQASGRGGAIKFYNAGPVTVSGSTFSGNHSNNRGGAMFFYKTSATTVSDSTISGNSASAGGGLFFYKTTGATTVSGSTISGNTAVNEAGGIKFYSAVGSSTIVNSTISGNTATSENGGGIVLYAQPLTINNSTVTGNSAPAGVGGGIYLSDDAANVLTLNSTIVANSTEQAGGTHDLAFVQGTFNATNSLVENATGITFAVNTANIFGVDPVLGPLANNGGPTLTHALLAGSPAIDTGSNPNALAFDQRGAGFPRTSGIATDMGAFEVQGAPPPPPLVTNPVPTLSQWGVILLSALTGVWALVTGFGRRRRKA